MKKKLVVFFVMLLVGVSLSFGQGEAAASGAGAASGGVNVPFFVGGNLGFGSGTGVGSERGLGINQIAGLAGYWYPRIGFARIGYGFSTFSESDDKDDSYSVDHSDIDVELGIHAYGDLYVVGTYARERNLSDVGDVSWNEWGVGFGSVINVISKTMLFAEIQYRWVLDHYDPFLDKNVSGTRLQFNLGFAVYVY